VSTSRACSPVHYLEGGPRHHGQGKWPPWPRGLTGGLPLAGKDGGVLTLERRWWTTMVREEPVVLMEDEAGVQLVPPVNAKFLRHYCEMEAMWFVGSK
jgi:hypothetical protein